MKTSIAEDILGFALVVAALVALALLLPGCTSTSAEWGGEDVVYGLDGAPLVDKDGVVQKVKQPVRLKSWKHWNDTHFDVAKLLVTRDTIDFAMNGYKSEPSEEFNKMLDTAFKGAAELAAKIGAAVATSGGSVAGEAGYAALKKSITSFVTKGGDASKATVTCSGGNCTISDGSIAETCTDCLAK